MFLLFIFESIGTAELILIGIVALIFLGPRKLPSIAKTIGKTMADLRNTTNEFKSTWEREVNFEDEAKAIRTGDLPDSPVERSAPVPEPYPPTLSIPEVRELDPAVFDDPGGRQVEEFSVSRPDPDADETVSVPEDPISDKRNWL